MLLPHVKVADTPLLRVPLQKTGDIDMTDAPWHAAKRVLYLDLETFCETPITHGTHKYAESAEVLLAAVALNDSPVEVWDTQDLPNWRTVLQTAIDDADEVVIQNSAFDRTVCLLYTSPSPRDA